MKIVLFTQRVDIVKKYNERRDCADQNITKFIKTCGYLPIPIPNDIFTAEYMIYKLKPIGIIFTGGNSIVKYGGNAPERDETENRILDIALRENIAVYGFCRGMQVILNYFGCTLENVEKHIAVYHMIYGEMGKLLVNSYHKQACKCIKNPLKILAQTEDGVIEALCHREKRILGTMWHPERENPFINNDIERVKRLFE